MSSFITAAENVARQRQQFNVAFKKMGEESTRVVELSWRWRIIVCLFLFRNIISNLISPKDSVRPQNY